MSEKLNHQTPMTEQETRIEDLPLKEARTDAAAGDADAVRGGASDYFIAIGDITGESTPGSTWRLVTPTPLATRAQ